MKNLKKKNKIKAKENAVKGENKVKQGISEESPEGTNDGIEELNDELESTSALGPMNSEAELTGDETGPANQSLKKIRNLSEKKNSKRIQARSLKLGISAKIAGVLALLLIAVFVSLLIYVSKTSNDKVTTDRIAFDKANNALYANQITTLINRADQANRQAALEVEEILGREASDQSVEDLLLVQQSILGSNSDFWSSMIVFEPDAFKGQDREINGVTFRDEKGRFAIYSHKDDDQKIVPKKLASSFYEGAAEQAQWYTETREQKAKNITGPHDYNGSMMISISMPVTHEGVFVGVISTDMNFQNIKYILEKLSTKDYTYTLTDIEGNLIVLGGTRLFGGQVDAESSATGDWDEESGATSVSGSTVSISSASVSNEEVDTDTIKSGATEQSVKVTEESRRIEGNIQDIAPGAIEIIENAKAKATNSWGQDGDQSSNDGTASIDVINQFSGARESLTSVPVEFEGYQTRWILFSAVNHDYFIKDARAMVNNLTKISIGGLAVLLILIAMVIEFGISKNIYRIDKALNNIANFDLSTNEDSKKIKEIVGRKDEIGNIAGSMNRMANNLSATITTITDSFHTLSQTVEEMSATAVNSADAATEINKAVDSIAQGASNQATDTQNASMSIEAIMQILDENGVILEQLVQATKNIETMKEEGFKELSELAQLFVQSGEGSVNINQSIQETSSSVVQIEKASQMIESIARQTNLLALNAAIEASRAGAAGRGFAVVATEIRRLAEQSAEFTKEISKVIDMLKVNSDSSVTVIEQINQIMEAQNKSLQNTQTKFEYISNAIDETKIVVHRLEASTQEIRDKNENLSGVVHNLSSIAEENAAIAEETSETSTDQLRSAEVVSKSSEELSSIANALEAEIDKFNL